MSGIRDAADASRPNEHEAQAPPPLAAPVQPVAWRVKERINCGQGQFIEGAWAYLHGDAEPADGVHVIARERLYTAPPVPQAVQEPADGLMVVACLSLHGSTLTVPAAPILEAFQACDGDYPGPYSLTFKTMNRADFEALGDFDGF